MAFVVDDLPGRIRAAIGGAVAGERMADGPCGVVDLLAAVESAAAHDGLDLDDLRARGLDAAPSGGLAVLLLRAVTYGLLSPAERPTLRRSAYHAALLGGADEGTAMTAVAAAVLTADLLRFDLDWCLARLHQTLLEEAPLALLHRLQPLPDDAPLRGDGDPGAALQIAITALHRAATTQDVLDELAAYGEDLGPALPLAGALAGARAGIPVDTLPPRAESAAQALAERAYARLSRWRGATTIESPGHDRN